MPFPSSHTILYKLFHYTFLKAKLKPNDWPVIYLQTRNDKKNIIACCYLNENDEIEIQMIDTNKGIEKKEKCIDKSVDDVKDSSKLKQDDREVSFDVKEDEREEKLNELVNDLEIEGMHKEDEKEKHEDEKSEESEEVHEEDVESINEEEESEKLHKEDKFEGLHKEDVESINEDECEDLHNEDVETGDTTHEQNNDSINEFDESMHKENKESINKANNEDKANINKDSTNDILHKDINKDSTEDSTNDRAMMKDSIQNSTNTRNAVNNNTAITTNKLSLYKQKKAILFLHDRNQTRYDNTEFISSLKSPNYTILIPDISGFADTKSKFSFPRSINDIQRCLDFLSSFDVTIIGSGFGAFLVINYASTFYDYKTVLINPTTFTHYYSSLFESYTINLEHFVSEKTIVFCVGQEESMKIGGRIGCKIYRSESDSVKSLMCNEEVVRKIDEFIQEE